MIARPRYVASLIASVVFALAANANAASKHVDSSPAIAAANAKVDAAKASLKSARKALGDAKKAARARRKERAKHVAEELTDADGNDLPDAEDVCRAIATSGESWEDACRRVTRGNTAQDVADENAERDY